MVASGNQKTDSCTVSPGRASTAISVAATDKADALWFPSSGRGSNYGKCVDILAPVCITTTIKCHMLHVTLWLIRMSVLEMLLHITAMSTA